MVSGCVGETHSLQPWTESCSVSDTPFPASPASPAGRGPLGCSASTASGGRPAGGTKTQMRRLHTSQKTGSIFCRVQQVPALSSPVSDLKPAEWEERRRQGREHHLFLGQGVLVLLSILHHLSHEVQLLLQKLTAGLSRLQLAHQFCSHIHD